MYVPGTFAETDIQTITGLIEQYPLGLLVSSGVSGLRASPLPFLYRTKNGQPTLISHLAKANTHWKDLLDLKACLVIFQGAGNYVTPAWYPSKQTTHKVVPTWNYEMVQVVGVPKVIESSDWLKDQVTEMTASMEAVRSNPWSVSDAPEDFIETQLKAIVGLEIAITEIKGKWKMSQNRTVEDAQGVAQGMSASDDPHANPIVATLVSSRIAR